MKKLCYGLDLEQLEFLICNYFGLVSRDLDPHLSLHSFLCVFVEKFFLRTYPLPSFHGQVLGSPLLCDLLILTRTSLLLLLAYDVAYSLAVMHQRVPLTLLHEWCALVAAVHLVYVKLFKFVTYNSATC